MRRSLAAVRVNVAFFAIAFAGCGVLDVPDQARQAVADWGERTGETDPCRVDAMEHCVGGSAAAAACGSACAIRLGELLERRQGDGNAMDLHNNAAGATLCGVAIGNEAEDDGANFPDAVTCCERLLAEPAPSLRVDGPCN